MPKSKASRRSAVTQPKFQTSEVQVKGSKVIISGELAADAKEWIESKNRSPLHPVSGEATVASVLSGLVAGPLGKQVEAKILLPADLAAWAEDEAYNQNGELSDLVRELLQFERYRLERFCTYVRSEGGANK